MRKVNFYLTKEENVKWIWEYETATENINELMPLGIHEIDFKAQFDNRLEYYRNIYEGKNYYKQLFKK